MERRPDPRRPVVRLAAMQAWRGLREKNTSRRLAGSAEQPPKVQIFLRPWKAMKATQTERPRPKLVARVAKRRPAKRRLHGNLPHSAPRPEGMKAIADHLGPI